MKVSHVFTDSKIGKVILFIVFFTSSDVFSAGPIPEGSFYRADTRTPEQIFGTAEKIGPGFQTWAIARGVPENTDVLAYLSGETVRPAPIESRNAGWVSVSGLYNSVINFLNIEVVGPIGSTNPPEIQYIYVIDPTEDAYSVNWMLNDYAMRAEVTPHLQHLMEFMSEDEWIIRGGVPAQHIRGVELYRFDPQTNSYEQEGEFIENPHFVEQPTPPPQTINPIDSGVMPDTIYGYTGTNASVAINASVALVDPYSSSCASIGASFSENREGKLPPAKGCNYSPKGAIAIKSDGTYKTRLELSDGYCLRPGLALTPSLLNQRSYLYVDYCDDNNVAYYDGLKRIVFPSNQNGLEMCMTSPEQVVTGHTEWDWVQFWPCDINNPYQKWYIQNGKISSYLNPKLHINIKGWYGVMSKMNNYGSTYLLDEKKMEKDFFSKKSSVQSIKKEIGIDWIDGGVQYPFSDGLATESYVQRTYYDFETKQISILVDEFQPVYKSGYQVIRCLSSNQGHSTSWKWASWVKCEKGDPKQQWYLEIGKSNPVDDVRFKDTNNTYLYFNLSRTVNYGYPYTQYGEPGTGSLLKIRRSYGICTTEKGWKLCNNQKHTQMENDGQLYEIQNSDFNILTPNGKDTKVELFNSGGYVAQLQVKYHEFINGKLVKRVKTTKPVVVGRRASVRIPKNAVDVTVTGFRKPSGTIFNFYLCKYNNRWYRKGEDVNVVEIKVWGTIFKSPWAFIKPKYTVNTETDNKKSCNF